MNQNLVDAFSKQMQQEFSNSYAYLAMSVWFDTRNFKGFAAYFRKQADEERGHGQKLLEFLLDRNAKPTFGAIGAPKADYSTVLDALKAAREAERSNTRNINALYELSAKDNDLAAQQHLTWFINEQVEEEKWAEEFVGIAEMIGNNHVGALFMFDHRVSKRAGGAEE